MSWAPNDLLTDADLIAYEATVLSTFGQTSWLEKRRRALQDWLFPILGANGFAQERFRTRFEADGLKAVNSGVYTDYAAAAQDVTTDDLNLATIFATVGTDALYVGSSQVFRGLSIRMLDAVSAVAATLTVSYWKDGWTTLAVTDETQKTTGVSFSGGGAVIWKVPEGWVKRAIDSTGPYYWVRLQMSATPTSAKASQIGVIRHSALCAPATLRTLALIMREAPAKGSGPWLEKAQYYQDEADHALDRALKLIGGEFETDDPQTDLISADEAAQDAAEVSGGWRLERG